MNKFYYEDENNQNLLNFLEAEGYSNLRLLPDGIIGTFKMLFTYALCIDLDRDCYAKRYCYASVAEAVAACKRMKSIDDEPLAGYKAVK